ncbi:hypothetical protein [Moraxella lacunata]|uniref:hypothetical protein n=1 Tax=Moraxella lacunata TaxID=477 RepID=UPI003EE3545B
MTWGMPCGWHGFEIWDNFIAQIIIFHTPCRRIRSNRISCLLGIFLGMLWHLADRRV